MMPRVIKFAVKFWKNGSIGIYGLVGNDDEDLDVQQKVFKVFVHKNNL